MLLLYTVVAVSNLRFRVRQLIKYESESYSDFTFPVLFSGGASGFQTDSALIHTPSPPTTVDLSHYTDMLHIRQHSGSGMIGTSGKPGFKT